MPIHVECTGDTGYKNTGAKEQCLEGLTIRTAVAVPGFKFDSIADAKDLSKWRAAIAAKQLFPLYDAEEWTSANTEDTIFEGRNRQYVTAQGKKIITYTSFLGFCSHAALKSFNDKEMRLFEFTEDNAILGILNDGGAVSGQDVILRVGQRLPATADRPAGALVTINYLDRDQLEDNAAVIRPTWRHSEIEGIFDISLIQISASSSSIKFKAIMGCAGGDSDLLTLLTGDLELLDASGQVHVFSFVAPDSNGVYELTGIGFANDFILSLDGVIVKPEGVYESPEPLVVEITTPSV